MDDFSRIARIIEYLDERHLEQPGLNKLAEVAGLSESHFHRLFRRWAGTTPKDFLQCLTAEHAKSLLTKSATVLDASLDAGLSGPGRLHDLMVTLEAMTPGEYRRRGRGLTIEFGKAASPFGECLIAWTTRGICHLGFGEDESQVRELWEQAEFVRNDREATKLVERIFSAKGGEPLKALVHGTLFQVKVWRALVQIPEGSLATYEAVASGVGAARAARAVGTACGANAIAYLIPCHRVIRQTGIVKGYRWGEERKKALIAWESGRG